MFCGSTTSAGMSIQTTRASPRASHPVYRVEVGSAEFPPDPAGTETPANTSSYTDAAYVPPPSNDLITAN